MRKHGIYSVLIGIFFGVCLLLPQLSNAQVRKYFTGTKIIDSSESRIIATNDTASIKLDFSEDTAWNGVGQKYHINANETTTGKEIVSADPVLDANKVLTATLTGLTPGKDYTLFLKPFNSTTNKNVDRTPPYTIAFHTYIKTLTLKSFNYVKTTPTDGKQAIVVTVLFEGVPSDSIVTFDVENQENPGANQQNIVPTKTTPAGYLTTYQYSNRELDNNGTYGVTIKIKDRTGKILFSQTKGPDTVNGSSNPDAINGAPTEDSYQFLTTLPGLNALCDVKDNNGNCTKYKSGSFGDYLQVLIKLTYGLIALIAVFQIIYYGVTYMLTATPFMKTTSKERIYNAIMGIVIALGSYLILYTINPNLVSINLNGPAIDITNKNPSLMDSIVGFQEGAILSNGKLPEGVICGSGVSTVKGIAESFMGHVTYAIGSNSNGTIKGKGEPGPEGTVNLDCSGYVDKVLSCANLPKTAGMDSGSAVNLHKGEAVTPAGITDGGTKVNGVKLVPGDVLGWETTGTGNKPNWGHLVIYIGEGKIANSTGQTKVGNAVSVMDLTFYQNRYTQIFRITPKTTTGTGTGTTTDTKTNSWTNTN